MASKTGEDTHEVRKLKRQIQQQNKTVGTQGDTIYRLRAELAEVRSLNSKIERGDLRRLERDAIKNAEIVEELREQIKRLREKLDADKTAETPVSV